MSTIGTPTELFLVSKACGHMSCDCQTCGCCCSGGFASVSSMFASWQTPRTRVLGMREIGSANNVSGSVFCCYHFSCTCKLVSARRDTGNFFCKAVMASKTVVSKRQMASSDTAAFCNVFGRKQRRRQSLRLPGLTLRWHETVSAAYVLSDCNLESTVFVAQKLSGLPPSHCDYPTQDLVEEIAVSVPLDAVLSHRAQKEAAELLVVREIQALNLRGVVPTSAAVYNMFQALQPSSCRVGHRGRDAWVQRFRKRWQLSRRAWPQKPDLTDEAAKNKAGGPKIGAFQWF